VLKLSIYIQEAPSMSHIARSLAVEKGMTAFSDILISLYISLDVKQPS
jgi:hypothetical protein